MARVNIDVTGFRGGYAHLNRNHQINVSRLKCVKFATSVGTSHYSAAFGRTTTAIELSAYRSAAVRCVLDFDQAVLRPFDNYADLESTEKMSLAYWIGMTFAAIAADEVLGVSRTTHASHYGRRIKRANPGSRSLADLVGQDAVNALHILEAKGRQTPPSALNDRDWKAQARTVRTIENQPIATRSYCVGLISDPFTVRLVDPPSDRNAALDLRFDPKVLGTAYYDAYTDFVRVDPRRVSRDNRDFIVRPIMYDSISRDFIYIGLEKQYFNLGQSNARSVFSVSEYEDDSFFVGKDGIAVAASKGPCDL